MTISDPKSAATEAAPSPRNPEPWFSRFRAHRPFDPKTFAIAMVDAAGTIIGLLIATTFLRAVTAFDGSWVYEGSIAPAAVMLVLLFALLGLYGEPTPVPCQSLKLRTQGVALAAGFGALAMSKVNSISLSLLWAALAASTTLVTLHFARWALERVLARLGRLGAPAAIIGTGDDARQIANGLLKFPEIGLRPVGFVALPEQSSIGKELPLPLLSRIEHVGTIDPRIKIAVVAMPPRDKDEIERLLGPLPFLQVATIQDMTVLHKLRLQTSLPRTSFPLAGRYYVEPESGWMQNIAKRTFDLALALPLAIITAPIALLAIAAVKLMDAGPAIYKQKRIGLNGRPFDVYKIRSMYQDAEMRLEKHLAANPALAKEWSENFKLRDDPRILAGIGHFLRTYSIDELPQLWNVIFGEMSLVGPRPFPVYHLKGFDEAFQRRRATVMPGLTGLWQISARSDGDLGVQKEQDLLYIENRSFWLDLHILLQTLPAVISAKGAR